VTFSFQPQDAVEPAILNVEADNIIPNTDAVVEVQRLRFLFIDTLYNLRFTPRDDYKKLFDAAIDEFEKSPQKNDPHVQELLAVLKEPSRIFPSFLGEQSYWSNVIRMHREQDPIFSSYGKPSFEARLQNVKRVCYDVPNPPSTLAVYPPITIARFCSYQRFPTPPEVYEGTYKQNQEPFLTQNQYSSLLEVGNEYKRATIAAAQYAYSYSSGCFDGNCSVLMADGQIRSIKDLRKGDCVKSVNSTAEIVCVVKFNCQNAALVELPGGAILSPFHPVKISDKWHFPSSLAPVVTNRPCDSIYNFVLNSTSEHIMIVNNIQCVTLGHNYQDDVVRHPFFGSPKVIEQLKKIAGWKNGFVEFEEEEGDCFVRDPQTNLVCGFMKQ